MNPNAAEKSLNSNTRCRFPFTTLHPLSFFNSAAISCSESFAAMMKASRSSHKLLSSPRIIRHRNNGEQATHLDPSRTGFSLSVFCRAPQKLKPDRLKPVLRKEFPDKQPR